MEEEITKTQTNATSKKAFTPSATYVVAIWIVLLTGIILLFNRIIQRRGGTE